MATCLDIIGRALQMARVIAIGEEIDGEEAEAGMAMLQGLYDKWVSAGLFGSLKDVYSSTDYEAQEGERIHAVEGVEVTLPDTIDCDGLRSPRDLSLIEVWQQQYDVYDRSVWLWDRNAWVRVDSLQLTDTAPLSNRGQGGLAACLALDWVEGFGGEALNGTIARLAASFQSALAVKLGSTQDGTEGQYF